MSFWTSEKLIWKQNQEELITPFRQERVKHGAYELSMGAEAFLTSEPTGAKQNLKDNEQVIIPPGQFGLLLTGESVAIPNTTIAFMSIKFGIKQRGLVNVSGFHVDPGFKGQLKFAVYNAGSGNIVLTKDDPVFLIWFCDLSARTFDIYDGKHAQQQGISSDDVMQIQGEVASPGELKKQIEELRTDHDSRFATLEDKITTRTALVLTLLTALLVSVFFKGCEQQVRNSPTPMQNTNQGLPTQQSNDARPSEPRSPQPDTNSNSSNTPKSANTNSEDE
jgi:dCTP deaminase